MESIEGLSNAEIRELIFERLKELEIDPETVEVEVVVGPGIILRGKVDFDVEQEMIRQSIADMVGMDNIIDELVVIRGAGGLENSGLHGESGLYDQDGESMGTEDAYRAIEDGIPYVPPMGPTYQESSRTVRWEKRKKEKK